MKLFSAMAVTAAICLLTGCASKQAQPEIEMRAEPGFDVQYNGEVGDVQRTATDLPEFTPAEEGEDLLYSLEVRVVRLPLARAEELFGDKATSIGAYSLAEDPFELKLLSSVFTLSAPRVTIFNGQRGTITITNEQAYISGFELHGEKGERLADPVVATVTDGIILGLRAVAESDTEMRLWADLTVAELETPIATQEVLVFGSPMTVQTPVIFSQRLKAEGIISEDRVLALTGMVGQSKDEVVIVLITAERAILEDAGDDAIEPPTEEAPEGDGE